MAQPPFIGVMPNMTSVVIEKRRILHLWDDPKITSLTRLATFRLSIK
jgi:hypothetical protein